MKKILAFILTAIMVFAIAACGTGESVSGEPSSVSGSDQTVEKTEKTFKMGVVNGAPALAVANIAGGFDYSDEKSEVKTGVEVQKDAPSVVAGLTNGTYDMAILPLNLASKLYNAGKLGVKLVSVNIFSVLYVITKGDYATLDDLKGKVVYSVGIGGTPEVVFKNILTANNIKYDSVESVAGNDKKNDTVYFNVVSDAKLVMAALKNDEADFALLGEPVVSQAMANAGAHIAFGLEDEWKKVHPDVGFVQAGLIVKSTVLESFGGYVDALLAEMAKNAAYLKANAEKAVVDLNEIGATLPALGEETLKRCLIGADKASERKADIVAFLSALSPADYGGKLPEDDFYAK